MSVYNIDGNLIGDVADTDSYRLFSSNMIIDYKRDSLSNTNYTVMRIFKNRLDGTKQYPFVYCPGGMSPRTKSTLKMNMEKGFYVAINSGMFDISGQYDSSHVNMPMGMVIANGVVIRDSNTYINILTIDNNGNLGVDTSGSSGQTLVNNGVISACVGIGQNPIINNYQIPPGSYLTDTAQRQVIGQFANGDYAIITSEGRNYDNSIGMTISQMQAVCQGLGLKFAYNLDGGGSTETVIGQKQINTIYEETYGRPVPTYIVFNGTDVYGEMT